MSEPAQVEVAIKDFRGMASNVDPTDLQPGFAEIQVNVNGYQRGQLEVRRGLREVEFEAED
jgi:hypothetical protein